MACSGKFVLRIPPNLHLKMQREAARGGISLNALCQKILSSHFLPKEGKSHHPFEHLLPPFFVQKIARQWENRIIGIVLFGSLVRGEWRENSDIDLLLVLADPVELRRDLYQEWDLFLNQSRDLLPHKRDISPQFVKRQTDPLAAGSLWYETALEGIVLWEAGFLISEFYREIRSLIASGKILREFSYGQPYWMKLKNKS